MRAALLLPLLFIGLLAARLSHINILWAEETLPMAASAQMATGKTLYRDIWFDKPPLLPAIYLGWGARPGWPLRVAGAAYCLLACWLAYRFAAELWGAAEGRWAASLMAFYLTFYVPSAVLPLAVDLTMVAPHLAAVYLAWRGRAFWSGLAAGLAFAINVKGIFVLAVCALWCYRSLPALAAGFLAPNAAIVAWLWSVGALEGYIEQVWRLGRIYAANTFVENPIANGITRTAAWLGFHAGLVAGSIWFWRNHAEKDRLKWAAWLALSLVSVTMGWRFFPRYYFQLLPVMVLLGARGACLMPGKARAAVLGIALLIPLVRFGPRYLTLPQGDGDWVDTAMDRESRAAAALVRSVARPSDTLFVWGYRPELYIYTGLPAATQFLDSQPLNGVLADRHLTISEPVASEFAYTNRRDLVVSKPDLVIDGLSVYNPKLAISAYPDLALWMLSYREVERTPLMVIYRRVK